MFNSSLKKQAAKIYDSAKERYDVSYSTMCVACNDLYSTRKNAVSVIVMVEEVVNSLANTPKEFEKHINEMQAEVNSFKSKEEFAQESYDASLKAGVAIASGVGAGLGMAAMAPTVLMSVATTFGTAATGTAIRTLSGAAAEKAAIAWIGRTFAGFMVKEGAGMAVGEAFLALAGPVGWSITAVSTGLSLVSLSKNNKKISDEYVQEAKEIASRREVLDELTLQMEALKSKINMIVNDFDNQKNRILGFKGKDYITLQEDDKKYLGSMIHDVASLAKLLNEKVE